ncbi:MAG TPA: cytochrome c oxidase assembly protein [Gammaproteobacteria bacterium]
MSYQHTDWLLPFILVIAMLAAYLVAAYRQRGKTRSWSDRRTACFALGIAVLVIAIIPPVADFAHHDLRGHMIQHLLIGMLAPLGLVFAAPVTLALKALPAAAGRYVVVFLHAPLIGYLSQPLTALLLNVGGMYLLYLTPLYAASLTSPALHTLVHIHFVIAGCLFTWAIAGPDPGPRRPGLRFRLWVLFVSMAMHATLAKLMYAYRWPRGTHHTPEEIQSAAQLMYYGGDLTELVLVIMLFRLWYRNQKTLKTAGPLQRKERLKTTLPI